MRHDYTKEKIDKIRYLYEEKLLSTIDIGKIIGMGEWSVRRVLHKIGVKVRSKFAFSKKYSIDESFFEKIDTEVKAYFLGWMYSDGCVYSSKKGYMFHLTLNKKDMSVLRLFRRVLKTKTPIHKCKNKNTYGFYVWSKKMYFDLINLGCVPRKSLILQFPPKNLIPEDLMRHFIRGYFDGDGSICFSRKRMRAEARIVSSLKFCQEFEQLLIKSLEITKFYHHKIVYSKVDKLPYCSIGMGSCDNIKKFYDYMYKNCKFSLKRKKYIFEKYLAYMGMI